MHTQTPTVTAALLANAAVSGIIGTNIFNDEPSDEAAYPCLTYEESLTPVGSADNEEYAYAIEWNMEAYQRGSAWTLADAVEGVMKSLGYMCGFKKSSGMVGVVHQVSMGFTMIKEV